MKKEGAKRTERREHKGRRKKESKKASRKRKEEKENEKGKKGKTRGNIHPQVVRIEGGESECCGTLHWQQPKSDYETSLQKRMDIFKN